MAQPGKLVLGLTVILFSALACGQIQSSSLTQTTSTPAAEIPTNEPTWAQASSDTPLPQLTATQTAAQSPTQSPTQPPGEPPTQPVEQTGAFQRITGLPAGLPSAYAEVQVGAPADGTAWVITSQGALRWDNLTWETELSEEGDMLASVDDVGRLWVLRPDAGEIAAWQNGEWTAYGAESGWTEAPTSAEMSWWSPESWRVQNDSAGRLWLPAARDVRTLDGERWILHSLEEMGFSPPEMEAVGVVHRLVMGKDGRQAWVGECYYGGPGPMGGQGVRWLGGEVWQGADAPVGATCVSAITVDQMGDVWLGAYTSVWRYSSADQGWTEYSLPEAFLEDYNFAYPRQLVVDGSGDAWVMLEMCGGASCSGPARVYRIHAGEWSLINEAANWDLPLKHLAVDGSGQGWLFWDGEVFRLEGEPKLAAAAMRVRGVGVSLDGKLWVVVEETGGAALWSLEP